MRTFLIAASLCACTVVSQAQTEKGRGIWTGSLSFNYGEEGSTSISRTSESGISFNRGVFFKDNWLVGGGLDMTLRTSSSSRSTNKTTTVSPGLSGFVRRYWGQDKWRVFLGGGLELDYSSINYSAESSSDENSFAVRPIAQLGANYYLTDRVGLEAAATSNSFPFSFGSLNVGVIILTGGNTQNSTETFDAPQLSQGRWVVGGSFEFETDGTRSNRPGGGEQRSNSFSISPSVGFFVQNGLLVGIGIPFSSDWSESGSTNSLGISPYVRKYFFNQRLRPFVGADVTYASSRSRNRSGNSSRGYSDGELGVSAGLAYLLGNRFIVEGTLGRLEFNKRFYSGTSTNRDWDIDVWAGLQPNFTITYVFGGN